MGAVTADPGVVADEGGAGAYDDVLQQRLVEFEAALGDPARADGPLGYRAVVKADQAAELPREGTELLSAAGLWAELVPRGHGGRFERADVLAQVLRSVSRRDAALGLGAVVGRFAAAAHVWSAGGRRQRDELAGLLLRGGRLAMAPPEFAQANGLTQNRIRLRRADDGGLLLSGRKPVIPCVADVDALVVLADSGEREPVWSAALLDAEAGRRHGELTVIPRSPAAGLRALTTAGSHFEDLRAPESALIGAAGTGLTQALSVIPLIHGLRASMALGTADAALRTAIRFALAGEQVDRTGRHGRRLRARFADAFAELLLCDCLALAATRAAHLLPAEAALYTAAAAFLVPRILGETLHDLSVVFGGRLFERDAGHGVFEKHLRDLPALSGGHAGASVFHSIVVPRLPLLARQVWLRQEPAPAELFLPHHGLPPLESLPVGALERDSLTAELTASGDYVPAGIEVLLGALAEELDGLRAACLDSRGAADDPRAFALADRYMLLLAAGAVTGVWRHARGGPAPFLAEPSWAVAVLTRICRRLGVTVPRIAPEHQQHLESEMLDRFEQVGSYDLYGMALAG